MFTRQQSTEMWKRSPPGSLDSLSTHPRILTESPPFTKSVDAFAISTSITHIYTVYLVSVYMSIFRPLQAVSNGHKSVAEHLMEKTDRAVLKLTDRQGRTALHYAAGLADDRDGKDGGASGDEEGGEDGEDMYKWLLKFGPDEKQVDGVRSDLVTNVLPQKGNLLLCS